MNKIRGKSEFSIVFLPNINFTHECLYLYMLIQISRYNFNKAGEGLKIGEEIR
jgi:hypothetical protein